MGGITDMQQSEIARRAWVPYLILIPITLPIVMMYTWLFVSSFSTGMRDGAQASPASFSRWSRGVAR